MNIFSLSLNSFVHLDIAFFTWFTFRTDIWHILILHKDNNNEKKNENSYSDLYQSVK